LLRAQAAVRLTALFSGTSLLHHRSRSMRQAQAYHHEHAGHWTWPIVKWGRLAWGYGVHLPVKAVTGALDEVLCSPAATLITGLTIAAFWYWH
jgi:hypothetical protein